MFWMIFILVGLIGYGTALKISSKLNTVPHVVISIYIITSIVWIVLLSYKY